MTGTASLVGVAMNAGAGYRQAFENTNEFVRTKFEEGQPIRDDSQTRLRVALNRGARGLMCSLFFVISPIQAWH